jgi:hypothetical protein
MEQFKEFVKQRINVSEEDLEDIISRYQIKKIKIGFTKTIRSSRNSPESWRSGHKLPHSIALFQV